MFKSVAGKLIFQMVIGAIVALIIGLFAVLQFKQQMLNENAITLLKAKDAALQQSFHEKMNTGAASLFSALAIMPELSDLFVNKDHAALRSYLGNLPKVFKQETEFKNIRLNAFDSEGNILCVRLLPSLTVNEVSRHYIVLVSKRSCLVKFLISRV